MIVAGYDEEGCSIYQISLGGSLLKVDWALGGSGSPYIYGLCDREFKKGMNKEDAVAFAKRCVEASIFRDNSSGGGVRIACIDSNGMERYNFFK